MGTEDRRSFVAALVAMCLCSCDAFDRTVSGEARSERSEPAQASGPTESALERSRKAVTGHMEDHFEAAAKVMDAIADADLEAAKEPAAWLAEHRPDSMPEPWFPYVQRMRDAARQVSVAGDLAAAAAGTGQIAYACGSCHQALRTGPDFKAEPEPPAGESSSVCMARHQWAADRLRDGTVGPSDEAWTRGVRVFAELSPCPSPKQGLPEGSSELRDRVGELAAQAGEATMLSDRARIYGDLLLTCGQCHTSGC